MVRACTLDGDCYIVSLYIKGLIVGPYSNSSSNLINGRMIMMCDTNFEFFVENYFFKINRFPQMNLFVN